MAGSHVVATVMGTPLGARHPVHTTVNVVVGMLVGALCTVCSDLTECVVLNTGGLWH